MEKIVKSLDGEKVEILTVFFFLSQSTFRNIKARSKTSKCDPKHKRASQNVKAHAETSKRQPKHQSASQNDEMQAEMVHH